MATFNEKDVLKVPVVLMNGPLDGQRYALPCVPPNLEVPIHLSLPLKQPATIAPFARYGRAADDEPIAGFYVFHFEDCVGPDGESALYAPLEHDEPVVHEVPQVMSTPV